MKVDGVAVPLYGSAVNDVLRRIQSGKDEVKIPAALSEPPPAGKAAVKMIFFMNKNCQTCKASAMTLTNTEN